MPSPVLAPPPTYPIGKVRSTGACIALYIVTFGIYSWFWFYWTHSEMQAHRRAGIGGALALVLALFVPFVPFFVTPSEVGELYQARGQRPPVSAMTGFWSFLPFAGPIVWFIETNTALNEYWRSLGAV